MGMRKTTTEFGTVTLVEETDYEGTEILIFGRGDYKESDWGDACEHLLSVPRGKLDWQWDGEIIDHKTMDSPPTITYLWRGWYPHG
jgi:hypothetical protein